MEAIELTARREALGMGVYAFADYIKVRHQNVARWEAGTYEPREWEFINEALTELEHFQEHLVKTMVTTAEENHREGQAPGLITFAVDHQYGRYFPETKIRRIPAVVHRVATARAAAILRERLDTPVEISGAPEEI